AGGGPGGISKPRRLFPSCLQEERCFGGRRLGFLQPLPNFYTPALPPGITFRPGTRMRVGVPEDRSGAREGVQMRSISIHRASRGWKGLSLLVLAGLSPLALMAPVSAAEWPAWRGPGQGGVSTETGLISKWSPEGENVIWRAPLVGRSTPV